MSVMPDLLHPVWRTGASWERKGRAPRTRGPRGSGAAGRSGQSRGQPPQPQYLVLTALPCSLSTGTSTTSLTPLEKTNSMVDLSLPKLIEPVSVVLRPASVQSTEDLDSLILPVPRTV